MSHERALGISLLVSLSKPPDKPGWYKPHLETSLLWLKELV